MPVDELPSGVREFLTEIGVDTLEAIFPGVDQQIGRMHCSKWKIYGMKETMSH
jgi:hypothetical protein